MAMLRRSVAVAGQSGQNYGLISIFSIQVINGETAKAATRKKAFLR
jgi:hypothetical protein